jgi:hypothetical protein
MAVEPFNSFGGFTTGIPPIQVIDSNGNVITNVNYPAGNVTANRIFANSYLFANGQPLNISAAGNTNQVQFNINGNFSASSSFTFQPSSNLLTVTNLNIVGISNLGNVTNVKILGGDNGYFLQTDGTGNLTWAPGSGGNGGNGTPGGANTQVQFNDSGSFGGDPGFTYDKLTNTLNLDFINAVTVTANLTGRASTANTANTVTSSAQPNITSLGNLTNLVVTGNTALNNLVFNSANANSINTVDLQSLGTANLTTVNVSGNITAGNANLGNHVVANFVTALSNIESGNGYINNQLTVLGNLGAGNISTAGSVAATNVNVTGNANVSSSATLRVLGDVNFTSAQVVNLGNINTLRIGGGVNGYVLSTDGTGNLQWVAGGGGGNGTPGGSNTQIQYNKNGTFAGSAFLTFNDATNNVQVSGNLIANALTVGSGIYQFSYSNVYFATTNSTSPNQMILAIEADNGVGGGNIAAVDYTIISTDSNIRNFIKISCVRMGPTVNYVEYSTLPVNGYTGDFQVQYNAGNVISPATIQLVFSPQTANLMTHKMMITAYYD